MAGVPGKGGRPSKPVEQKRALGNPGGRPLTNGGAALAIVEPIEPTMADQSPLSAFDQVMNDGVSWLARTDAPALALLRELLEERERMKAMLTEGMGNRSHLRDLDKQVISLLSQLGFDPAARSRLGLAEVKAASKLEGIRASQAKRVATKVAQ